MQGKTPKSLIWFYILVSYVIVQFAWWAYHLINLSKALYSDDIASKRITMIVGEGSVFFVLLLIGVWQLKKSIKREMQLNRDQKNFLLATTHELKTPLSSVKLLIETVQKRDLTPEKKEELLNRALDENDRLNDMIDRVLMASRIESEGNKLNFTQGDVSQLVNAIIDDFQNKYPNRTIEALLQDHLSGKFDESAVFSILTNLMENAIKYSDENTTITISLAKHGEMLDIIVEDSGVGILDTKKAVKLFYREQNEETRTEKGSGLGLFIVNKLCQLHGGELRLDSNLGIGTKAKASIKI